MKLHIEVDCTAEEARRFFGLPDVQPLQEDLLKQVQERLSATLNGMDAEALMKSWMPAGTQLLDQWQAFWKQMGGGRKPG